MPKATTKKEPTPTGDLCHGGKSFNCKKIVIGSGESEGPTLAAHMAIKWEREKDGSPVKGGYHCRFCNEYMGCKMCAERPSELVCLRCNDWALNAGEKKHGRMVKDREKGAEGLRLVSMIYDGRMSMEDGLKCIEDLFPGSGAQDPDPFWDKKAFLKRHELGARALETQAAGRQGISENPKVQCQCEQCKKYRQDTPQERTP
jgi:hypothetical protein